ncbi:MAG: Heat shock protein GrpE [Oscillospiraceae bacterium]|jgi:molecular chaperone GrpE|nr:Heat shock protein GrpE [Oscillospiraceae bacterium]
MADKEKITPQQAEETQQNAGAAEKEKVEKEAAEANVEEKANEAKPKEAPERTELEKLQDDYAALNDKYLRLMAEYDNFRKRSQRERDAIYPEATAAAATAFLNVADNFERALAAECADAEYKKGTELTYQSLMEAFSKLKVEKFGEPGDAFDPNRHNAVMHVEDDSVENETVVEVFQKGYLLGDRIIRHAMVKVAN